MPEKKKPAERRSEILAVALKAFDAHGFAGTTIDAVAEEAGIAKGSVYNYFRSKQELFYQVLADVIGGAKADVGPMLEDPKLSATEKLRRMLDYWSDQMAYFASFGRLVLEFWATAARSDRQGELAAALRESDTYWLERIGAVLAEGIASGDFRGDLAPEVSALLIMVTMDGVMLNTILGIGPDLDASVIDAMKQSILVGLAAGGEAPTTQTGEVTA